MSGFRRVYPSKDRVKLDGGMNSNYERALIEDSQSPDCQNVRFSDGGVRTRGGTTLLTPYSLVSAVGDGIYTRHDQTGAETMIVFAGAKMFTWSGSTFTTVPSALSVFTGGIRVAATEQENYLYVNNGGSIPYKYNGADFTRHGVYPPTVAGTVTSGSTGSLTGQYQYKMTNVNTNLVESNVGPTNSTFTAASATMQVTLPTCNVSFGVNSRRLYRTLAGGTVFKRVATISDNSTSVYSDNVADASLGVNAPTDNGLPPAWSVIKYHQGFLFMNDTTNKNFLWWTNAGTPYTVASTNFIKVGDNTFDLIQGIEAFEGNIVINCTFTQYILIIPGADPTAWTLKRVQSPFGSKSPFGCFPFNDKLMVPVMEQSKFIGFAPMFGDSIAPTTAFLTINVIRSMLASQVIKNSLIDIQEAYCGNISAITFNNRAYISVTNGDGNTTNNRLWVFDYNLDKEGVHADYAWSRDTGVNAAQFTQYGGNLYFVTSTNPCFVNQYETANYNDNGIAIDSYFWTKEFTADNSSSMSTFKDFRFVKLLVDMAGAYYMNLNTRVDSDHGQGNFQQISLNPGGALWGSMKWGSDLWGGGSDQEDLKIFLGGESGERIQFLFSNQNKPDQRFNVHGFRFYFNEKGYR